MIDVELLIVIGVGSITVVSIIITAVQALRSLK